VVLLFGSGIVEPLECEDDAYDCDGWYEYMDRDRDLDDYLGLDMVDLACVDPDSGSGLDFLSFAVLVKSSRPGICDVTLQVSTLLGFRDGFTPPPPRFHQTSRLVFLWLLSHP
jgi:hypothetical protein